MLSRQNKEKHQQQAIGAASVGQANDVFQGDLKIENNNIILNKFDECIFR